MKRVGLCVDDFGLKPEINEAVIRLIDEGIITAVGCMSTGPAWLTGAQLLAGQRRDRVDVGVHLTLTEPGAANDADLVMPLSQVIARSVLRVLPQRRLCQTIHRQLSAFEEAFGSPPDFLDGHQHVHQLPQVRDALMQCLVERYPTHRPWLRCTVGSPRSPTTLKQTIIACLGSTGLREKARARGYAMNRHLLGVYGFDADAPTYARLLAGWLEACQDGDLLMLHPAIPPRRIDAVDRVGSPDSEAGDVIAAAREIEFQVLTGDGLGLLAHHGVRPVRLSRHPELLKCADPHQPPG